MIKVQIFILKYLLKSDSKYRSTLFSRLLDYGQWQSGNPCVYHDLSTIIFLSIWVCFFWIKISLSVPYPWRPFLLILKKVRTWPHAPTKKWKPDPTNLPESEKTYPRLLVQYVTWWPGGVRWVLRSFLAAAKLVWRGGTGGRGWRLAMSVMEKLVILQWLKQGTTGSSEVFE